MTQDNLRDVISLRMQLAREVLDLAEEHRDEVWGRLRSRLSGLDDSPDADAETAHAAHTAQTAPSASSTRRDGPERRRSPAEPRYAGEEPQERRLSWPRFGLIHIAGAALIASAVAAAIALS